MQNQRFPFAVRLLGFSDEDALTFDRRFSEWPGKTYFRLTEGNLQDPDIYIANGDDLHALVDLADAQPSAIRPALLIGQPPVAVPYLCLAKPLSWGLVFESLDDLINLRADALTKLSGAVAVPERRRGQRVDVDLTDPEDYKRMRSVAPVDGGVLVVDKNAAFCDVLADLLSRYKLPVSWVSDEKSAIDFCRDQSVALVMINLSTPNIDPYRLAAGLKPITRADKTFVTLLAGPTFVFNSDKARQSGVDGFLLKPISGSYVAAVLKKFLPALT